MLLPWNWPKISKISDLILLQWEPCAICGMRFPFSEDLDTHVKLDHSKKSALKQSSVCCQFCGKKFITPDYMYRHTWKKHARQAQGKCTNIVVVWLCFFNIQSPTKTMPTYNPHPPTTSSPPMPPCTTHQIATCAPTYARPCLPDNPNPSPSPPNPATSDTHYTAAVYFQTWILYNMLKMLKKSFLWLSWVKVSYSLFRDKN